MEKVEWNREPDAAALEKAAALEFEGAVAEFERLVEHGSVLSMANLGHRYEFRPKAEGGPDFDKAEYWYKRSIDAGSAVATLPVGYFYLRRKDYKNAFEVFSIGLGREYAPSILRLAHLYANGLGVEKNEIKTDQLLLMAGRLGNLWAKAARAERYMKMDGRNFKIAKGLCLLVIVAVQFRFERKFRPGSEKLRK